MITSTLGENKTTPYAYPECTAIVVKTEEIKKEITVLAESMTK